MNSGEITDPAVLEWLRRFDRASSRLPESDALELRQELIDHVAADLGPAPSHAAVLEALGRLGLPEDVVDEALQAAVPRAGGMGAMAPAITATSARDQRRLSLYELGALLLLTFGGAVFGLGWIAGIALLWTAPRWTTRERWIGTFVLPLGTAAVALLVFDTVIGPWQAGCSSDTCVATPGGSAVIGLVTAFAFLAAVPVLTAVALGRRAVRRPFPAAPTAPAAAAAAAQAAV